MFRLPIAAAAMLLAIPAASADPLGTRWDMSPEEVVRAVEGATTVARDPEDSMRGLDTLAVARVSDGAIAISAGFFFTPGEPKLRLINMRVTDKAQCGDYLALLKYRHGPGTETKTSVKIGEYDVPELDVVWRDKNGDHLLFAGMYLTGGRFGLCKLIRTPAG